MEVVFHSHHAPISDHMRRRAETAVRKVAKRAQRPVDAVIRFTGDGPQKSVEIELHIASGRRYRVSSRSRFFGNALADATRRLTRQLDHKKRTPKARARRLARSATTA